MLSHKTKYSVTRKLGSSKHSANQAGCQCFYIMLKKPIPHTSLLAWPTA